MFSSFPSIEIPKYKSDLIADLKRYAHTAGLRNTIEKMKLFEEECARIKKMAEQNFTLKKAERRVQL